MVKSKRAFPFGGESRDGCKVRSQISVQVGVGLLSQDEITMPVFKL
jgi:hypothetical protein